MLARVVVVCLVGVLGLASPARDRFDRVADSASPIHIIKPPVRCPEGMKPDANGRCRVVWEKSLDSVCSAGQEPDGDGVCRQTAATLDCHGEDCRKAQRVEKREDGRDEHDDDRTVAPEQPKKQARMEALQSEKKGKKRNNLGKGKAGKRERSKHAFLMMLKKKKMQMMKPKPPPPPPPPHHPPHHHPPHHGESEEQPEEEPVEEETPAPERLFFGDEACIETGNSTEGCPGAAEMIENVETNDFKEWEPEKSSESSESSDSSSSSDSAGESDSVRGSGESEDEVLQKAIKIKLMKLFRMKQRYGPALRRWLVARLREYEDSFDY